MNVDENKQKQSSEDNRRITTSGDIEVSTYLEIAEAGAEQPVSPKEAAPQAARNRHDRVRHVSL